jgi:hypothetical protein
MGSLHEPLDEPPLEHDGKLMFAWLWNWRKNRERDIFRFWDGRENRRIDPLKAFRELRAHKTFNADEHLEALKTADDEEAIAATVEAAHDVFGIKPLSEGGLTEAECIALVDVFYGYLEAVKKNSKTPPISLESTDQEFSDQSTTKPESDSSSTLSDRASEQPVIS